LHREHVVGTEVVAPTETMHLELEVGDARYGNYVLQRCVVSFIGRACPGRGVLGDDPVGRFHDCPPGFEEREILVAAPVFGVCHICRLP
jgi:hypothetical protein